MFEFIAVNWLFNNIEERLVQFTNTLWLNDEMLRASIDKRPEQFSNTLFMITFVLETSIVLRLRQPENI